MYQERGWEVFGLGGRSVQYFGLGLIRAVRVVRCAGDVSWGPANLGVIIVVCVYFCGFWWITVAGRVGEDFYRFGVWVWGFPGSAYGIGVVWFGIFVGMIGMAASRSRKICAWVVGRGV